MVKVKSRINNGVIELSEIEREKYTGAGIRLALFKNNILTELFNPFEVEAQGNDLQDDLETILAVTKDWVDSQTGDIFYVVCSGGVLVRPIPILEAAAVFSNDLWRAISE